MDIRGEDVKAAEPEQLIQAYSGFVTRLALQYLTIIKDTGAIDLDDLKQEGTIALITAQQSYDPGKGVSFATWAAGYIKCRIRNAIGFKSDGIIKCQPELILDAPVSDTEDISLLDSIPDESILDSTDLIIRSEEAKEVREAVERIRNKDQRQVIQSLFFDGKDYRETAKKMGTSVELVKSRKENAISALRKDHKLKAYMLPSLANGSISVFRSTGATIEEIYILEQERAYDERHGEGSFVRDFLKKDEPFRDCLE